MYIEHANKSNRIVQFTEVHRTLVNLALCSLALRAPSYAAVNALRDSSEKEPIRPDVDRLLSDWRRGVMRGPLDDWSNLLQETGDSVRRQGAEKIAAHRAY